MPSIISFATTLASLLLLSAPALAIDGEILIDQAKVNAGGITPGDAPGFPATLSKSGRYKLAGNLRVPADSDGIAVTQHDVIIDLNGFTISSNPPDEASRGVVTPTNVVRLRVTNGTITGFRSYGILNPSADVGGFGVVENMRIVSNGVGISIGTEARIRDSTIANSPGGNIGCSQNCLIERSVITGSPNGGGISMTGGTVLGNVIVSNKFFGIFADLTKTGYGNNILFGNNGGGGQVAGPAVQMHPNVCEPACP